MRHEAEYPFRLMLVRRACLTGGSGHRKPNGSLGLVAAVCLALAGMAVPSVDALAQSQAQQTGYGRPTAQTRPVAPPSGGVALSLGAVGVAGVAAAIGVGIAAAGSGGDDSDRDDSDGTSDTPSPTTTAFWTPS